MSLEDKRGGWTSREAESRRVAVKETQQGSLKRYMKVPIRESALNICCAMRSTGHFMIVPVK